MARASVSIYSLIFLIGSISAAKHPNIIGGDNAEIKDFPYLVSIRKNSGHQCGGSIISDRHILTAAHCVYGMDEEQLENLTIHSGTSRTDKPGDVHKILSVKIHPAFRSRKEVTSSDDIALLTLRTPIVFNKYQQKIDLPDHDVQKYQVAYVIGWGRMSKSEWKVAPQLQKLQVALLPSEICQRYLVRDVIDEKQLCSFRGTTRGFCHGDSGSTLVSHGKIVGIVQRLDITCAVGTPDIYNNVFAYKDFIESAMKE